MERPGKSQGTVRHTDGTLLLPNRLALVEQVRLLPERRCRRRARRSHRALQPGGPQNRLEASGAELGSWVGVDDDDTVGRVDGCRRPKHPDRQVGRHLVRDGVAEDLAGEQDLDRAALDLPVLGGRMLCDVRDPFVVRLIHRGIPADVLVVSRRKRSLALATLAPGHAPEPLPRTQSPRPSLPNADAGPFELVHQEPIADRQIIAVRIDQGIDHMRTASSGLRICCFSHEQ